MIKPNSRLLIFAITLLLFALSRSANAQDSLSSANARKGANKNTSGRRQYIAIGYDGPMVSKDMGTGGGYARYSVLLNTGLDVHFDLNGRVGFFIGGSIKNLGFKKQLAIKQFADTNVYNYTWRTIALGMPIGIKIGNMHVHGSYLLGGTGFDAGFVQFEKLDNGQKQSYSTPFGRTTPIVPYIFAGACLKDKLAIKLQYYIGDWPIRTAKYSGSASLAYACCSWHFSNHNCYKQRIRRRHARRSRP